MKKFTTKLLMSIIAVAFAFVALGTSTYAWFSMNDKVTVSGMQLSAKSDSTYLIIGDTNDLATLQGDNKTAIKLEIEKDHSYVYPSGHGTITKTSEADLTASGKYSNWFYKVAKNPDSPAADPDKETVYLETAKFDKYVKHETVYVVLAKGSNQATNLVASLTDFKSNETATSNTPTNHDNSAVKVLITSATKSVELDKNNLTSSVALADTVDDQNVIQLDIYLYYDGENPAVYTNNILNLDGATFTINFSVTAVAQGN